MRFKASAQRSGASLRACDQHADDVGGREMCVLEHCTRFELPRTVGVPERNHERRHHHWFARGERAQAVAPQCGVARIAASLAASAVLAAALTPALPLIAAGRAGVRRTTECTE